MENNLVGYSKVVSRTRTQGCFFYMMKLKLSSREAAVTFCGFIGSLLSTCTSTASGTLGVNDRIIY